MKTLFLNRALPAAAILAAAFAPMAASAEVVTEWDFVVESEFTDATVAPGTTVGDPGTFIFTPLEISWGRTGGTTAPGGGRSALVIGDTPAVGTVFTDGAFELGNSLSHLNRVISSTHERLDTATLSINIQLDAAVPDLGDLTPYNFAFDISFTETRNDPAGGVCADGTLRTDPENAAGCRDIFVIDLVALEDLFVFEGELYKFIFRDVGGAIGTLSDGACAAAGAASGCIGFLTFEDAANLLQFEFAIEHLGAVPEPAMLGLLGLGLVGIGAARRRRKA